MPDLRLTLATTVFLLAACGGAPVTEAAPGEAPGADLVEVVDGALEIPATVHPRAFEKSFMGMPGYHLIVWDSGSAGHHSLFKTPVSDVALLDALESLGAEPGDALDLATWDERDDPDSPAPDRVIEGPPVEISVRLASGRTLALDDFLEDPGGRGFDMRFGGHRANIPKWKSGCIACLYSCPGSKVGNATYTVRDYVSGATEFRVEGGVLPEEGSRVTLVLRPR
jgi:hypothetical protein